MAEAALLGRDLVPVAASQVAGGHLDHHHRRVGLVAGEPHGVAPGGELGVGRRHLREPGGLHQVTRRRGGRRVVTGLKPGSRGRRCTRRAGSRWPRARRQYWCGAASIHGGLLVRRRSTAGGPGSWLVVCLYPAQRPVQASGFSRRGDRFHSDLVGTHLHPPRLTHSGRGLVWRVALPRPRGEIHRRRSDGH